MCAVMLVSLAGTVSLSAFAADEHPFVYEDIGGGRLEITKWTKSTGLTLTIPSHIDGKTVVGIGVQAFENCRSFSSIVFPDTLEYIAHYAFRGCTRLRTLTVPEGVTSIKTGAFYNCTGLYSIALPKTLTQLGENAFYNTFWFNDKRKGLIYLDSVLYTYKGGISQDMPVSIAEGITCIADRAFGNCAKLTAVTLPSTLRSIGFLAFSGCDALKEIVLPDSLETIGSYAFMSCTGLREVNLPAAVNSLGDYVFAGCSRLEKITAHESNQSFVSADGVLFSKDMKKLVCMPAGFNGSAYTVPGSVEEICAGAFLTPKPLDLEIPDTVNVFGEYAFGFTMGIDDEVFVPSDNFTAYCIDASAAHLFCTENSIACALNRVYTDAVTGVRVTIPEKYSTPDTSVSVKKLHKGAEFGIAKSISALTRGVQVYAVAVREKGEETIPAGVISVCIPIPEGVDAQSCKIVRLSDGGKAYTRVAADSVDGYFAFTSRIPGAYALLYPSQNGSTHSSAAVNTVIILFSLLAATGVASAIVFAVRGKSNRKAA
ncbi:MAG: leucine-rich repeat domain-containing protein [Clostridiales bacterium]|nr:leucine-rich repeat domain-containing protein [Clostridiales bacterium]